jgi:4-hydroxy-tetrahydrodipicolinate reductase
MKIALIGYGKMGKAIEAIATERGHEVVLKVGIENLEDFTPENMQQADVAIEFTGPESAFENLNKIMDAGLSVVSGSTGWLQHYEAVAEKCQIAQTGFLYASNFSLGVNLFFALNKYLAKLMSSFPEYHSYITEIHHTEKLDAPSGTAITLAEQMIAHLPNKTKWTKEENDTTDSIFIESKRIDPAPGTHTIRYASAIDTITIEHEAHSRQGFAIGAVLAAEFLHGKKGVFTMNDVLKLPQ